MLFNSLAFAIFLPVVFGLYWFVPSKNLKLQNLLLLISSYFFYAFWDWRFLFLLVIISLINFYLGLIMPKSEKGRFRRLWFIIGLVVNIGALAYFKYANFFIDGFVELLGMVGFVLQRQSLQIILPLGISFYVFLSLSYIIDVYQGKLEASRNLVDVLLTLSFFPIILAGPIQRPISLLPQIQRKRVFNYAQATDGLKQILWGLFMKIVIADRCAIHANNVFQNFDQLNGSTLLLGGIFFTIQIYADFAGYSLIAIGVSKLLGIELMRNFAYPYFSRNISEYWKKWHISLTMWFRDYVFLPISYAVSRRIISEKVWFLKTDIIIYIIGITLTWLLTGLWHGANYTFILWGCINGFFLIVYQVMKKPRNRFLKRIGISSNNHILIGLERFYILAIVVVTWIVFRAENVGQALSYFSEIISPSLFSLPTFAGAKGTFTTIILVFIFIIIEWIGREKQYPIAMLVSNYPKAVRWGFYYCIVLAILFLGGKQQEFIYFQF